MKKMTLAEPQGIPGRSEDSGQRRTTRGRPVPAAVLPPRRGLRGDRLSEGAAGEPRRFRSGAAGDGETADHAGGQGLRGDVPRVGQAGDRHHHGVRPAGPRPVQGPGDRQARGADHPGRGPHVRHGLVLPVAADLQPVRPAVHRRRRQSHAGLQGVRAGRHPARGHRRGRFGGHLHGGVDKLRHARRADDPDVHLLFDVRVPADRGRLLGGRRPDGPRLRPRRHRRPHHADRRGAAARRRSLVTCWPRPCRTWWPTTRHTATRSRTSSRTDCAGCTAAERGRGGEPSSRLVRRRGHPLLHHHVQRAVPAAGRAGRPGRGGPAQGHVPAGAGRRDQRPGPGAAAGVRGRRAVGAGGPAAARPGLGRRGRRLVGDQLVGAGREAEAIERAKLLDPSNADRRT